VQLKHTHINAHVLIAFAQTAFASVPEDNNCGDMHPGGGLQGL